MEQSKLYLNLSDEALFENWNQLEHMADGEAFRWSTGESKIKVASTERVWCSLKLNGSKSFCSKFSVLLNDNLKVLEGDTSPNAENFYFCCPMGTSYITIKAQGHRPCDYSSSPDIRTLGVMLREVCFYQENWNLPPVENLRPSFYVKEFLKQGEHESSEYIIDSCEAIARATSISSKYIATIYGCIMCLLEQFPGRKLSQLDTERKLQALIADIDTPCFDAGEVSNVFSAHADSFLSTSLDLSCRRNWKKNTSILGERSLKRWRLVEPKVKIFAFSEDLVFFCTESDVYLNHPKGESLRKLFSLDFDKDLINHEQWLVLRQVNRAGLLKYYKSLKSKVDTPWIPADDRLLSEIRKFRHFHPHSEKYDWLMGRFFLRRGDLKRARRYAYIGLRRRRLEYHLSELMGDVLTEMGEYVAAAGYYARMMVKNAEKNTRFWMVLENNELNADDRTRGCLARLLDLAEEKSPELREACLEEAGRVLITERARYGTRQKLIYDKGKFDLVDLADNEVHGIKSGANVFYSGTNHGNVSGFEYWQGRLGREFEFESNMPYILPLLVPAKGTNLNISYDGITVHYGDSKKAEDRFKPNQWQHLFLQGELKVEADKEIVAGTPFYLHPPFKKRRLVVNLLVDAVSMEEIGTDLAKYMPNTYKFFSKGTIFGQTYAVADWTHPCTASMFYGLNLRRTQIYHSRINLKQLPGYRNVAEELHEQGYLCCDYLNEVPRFLANDAYRGYDTHKTIGFNSEPYIANALHFLQVVPTNIYLNMHFMDVHNSHFITHKGWTLDIDSWDISFKEVMKSDMFVQGNNQITKDEREGRLSVYLHAIRETDRKLGMLYDYLEKNYADEDYLVVLHSDHGGGRCPMFEHRHHFHTCLMARGCGVPALGIVNNEVVSALDWFSIFEHFCGFKPKLPVDARLPKAFGGPGRDYAISQRLYPDQNYIIAINDLSHEFYCYTSAPLTYDAKADMGTAEYHLYRHIGNGREEVFDRNLLDKYFTLAYKEAKYFDEPDEVDYNNPFTGLLKEPSDAGIKVSVVLDGRTGNDISLALQSFGEQNFQGMELKILLSEADVQNFEATYSDIHKDGHMVVCSVGGDFSWQTFWQGLGGEYVFILSGDEILAPTAVEALYHSAVAAGADVVENTCIFNNAGKVRKFPQDIYDKMMHPVEGSFLPWKPVQLPGTVSSRCQIMEKESGPVRIGTFLIRRDFFQRSGFSALEICGGMELLAYELLFRAEKYLRISAPTHAYGKSKSDMEPERCIRSLLNVQAGLEKLIGNVPYLQDKLDWQDKLREKFFQRFEARYLNENTSEVLEKAFAKVLTESHQVSGWLVKYLFGRAIGK